MEQCKTDKNVNKRTRDVRAISGSNSDFDSYESKRVCTEVNAGSNPLESNRVELETELHHTSPEVNTAERLCSVGEGVDLDSPEAKQIREDILDILDEPETAIDREQEIQDLDSVIKSFEEEILHPRDLPPHDRPFIDLTLSDSGGDLGYLLEASDDELGLPPTVSYENDVKSESRSGNTIGLENELVRYDSFDLGMVAGIMDGDNCGGASDGDYLTVGGLFDYPEPSDISRRTESLPA